MLATLEIKPIAENVGSGKDMENSERNNNSCVQKTVQVARLSLHQSPFIGERKNCISSPNLSMVKHISRIMAKHGRPTRMCIILLDYAILVDRPDGC